MSVIKPILKWVGGKTQILDEVLAEFPIEMKNYYEPFLGGGSVLLGVLSLVKAGQTTITGKVYASDVNPNIVGFYSNVQKDPERLIRQTREIINEFEKCTGTDVNREPQTLEEAKTSQESYYYWIRGRFNALSKDERAGIRGSAMLLFLNKTCFRGVYREGPKGFNVPFGHYTNPGILDEQLVREVSQLVKDVVFQCCPFQKALEGVREGDFVYLDPPYAPEKDTSFVGYVADGFGLDEHKALFKLCGELSKKKVKLVMSNADVKLVRDAFPAGSYETTVIECRRAIHSKKPETKTNEVLIRN
jgi:DNA adenine methylase